jgi:hypothetical protein
VCQFLGVGIESVDFCKSPIPLSTRYISKLTPPHLHQTCASWPWWRCTRRTWPPGCGSPVAACWSG